MRGSGDFPLDALVARSEDIVVVTFNYRLNVFGFLASKELQDRDQGDGSTGNYGDLTTQQLAYYPTTRRLPNNPQLSNTTRHEITECPNAGIQDQRLALKVRGRRVTYCFLGHLFVYIVFCVRCCSG